VRSALSFWLAAEALPTLGALRSHPEEVQELARHRLSRLFLHLAQNNPFYGRRLQRTGIEWADPILQRDPYRALAALQPVTKAELRRAGTRALDQGALNPQWYSSSSSGSTGEPFRVYYEARAWARLKYLVKLRARIACGMSPTDRVALLDAVAPAPFPAASFARRWARISVLQPAPELAAALSTFNPDVLYGLPSALMDAGRLLQEQGQQLRVRALFTSGELLHPLTRKTLSQVFGAPVYDIYGTSETKEIAWQCPDGEMHLNADVVHLEVLDDAGRILPPNVEGNLVATLLVNRAMPLIRYRTGDRGALRPGRCSCGCTMPLLGVVTGRTVDVLVMRGGRRISPYALTCAIEKIPGVLRYQVSQLDQARVRVRAILEAAADRGTVAAQVRSALRYDVAPFLEADVEFVDRLPTGPRAKFRVVEALEPREIA
jgi:phenylacetate-coenzyme A ligase PaaK-like adenylate-forming protein